MPSKTLYYAVHVSNRATSRRGTGWVWSGAYDTARLAADERDRCLRAGDATLAFVVSIGPQGRNVLVRYIRPPSAQKIVGHFLELEDRLMTAEEGKPHA